MKTKSDKCLTGKTHNFPKIPRNKLPVLPEMGGDFFAKFISWHCCKSSMITNLQAECTKLHNCKCCSLQGSFNLMAPNFELCCFSLPQFYRKLHDTFKSLTQDSSYIFSGKFCSFRNDICIFLILNPQKTNRTKILRKLWCARLQNGVEGVIEDKGTFTYPPTFSLPLVFENFSHIFIEYSTVTFEFDPFALLPTGYRKRTKTILFGACGDIKKCLLNG